MSKKKPIDMIEQSAPDVPPMPQRGREVIYTIVVPNCTDLVATSRAERELTARSIPGRKMHIYPPVFNDKKELVTPGRVEVPRLVVVWQGDEAERLWQRSIQEALPGALIDVADWTPAPGYPQGEIGEPTDGK